MDRFTRLSVTESLSEDDLFSERAKKASGRSFAGTHAAGGILQKGDPLSGGDSVGKRISSGPRKPGAPTAAMANCRVPLGYEDVLGGPPLLTESLFAAQTQNFDHTDNIFPSPAQVYDRFSQMRNVNNRVNNFASQTQNFDDSNDIFPLRAQVSDGFSQMQNVNNRANNFASQTQNFDDTHDIFPSRAQIYHEFSQMQNVNDRGNIFASHTQTSNLRTEQIRRISGCPRTSSLPVFGASIYDDDVFGGAYHDVSHRASVGDSMRGLTKAMERKAAAKFCTSSLHTIPLNSARCFASDSASDESVITSGSSESRSEGDEVPSQQPFSYTAVQKDKDKPLQVSRSYSVVYPSSDLNPVNFTYCSRNSNRKSSNFISSEGPPDFVDFAPSNPPASFIRSMRKLSDFTKGSESENQARSSGYKELAREGYFVRRMHARNNAVEQPKICNGTEVDATANDSVVLDSMLPFQSNQSSAESFGHKNVRNIKSTKVEESRNADELCITRNDVKVITSPSSLTCSLGSPLLCTLKQMSVPRKSKTGKDEQVIHNVGTKLDSFQCGTSESWTEGKKDVASVLENQADASSGDIAASMTLMKEAMERAALKLKLAKEARKWEKDECGNGLERMKCRDEREKIYEGGEKQRLGNETWKAHLIEEMEKEDNKKANRDQAYEKKEWELNGDLKEHRVVSERAYSHAFGLKKGTESFPAEVYETATGLEKTRADSRDCAVERERTAVKRVMAEARTRVENAALDPATKEACEQVALRAEVERAATEARERAERIAATVRKQQQRNKNDSRSFFEKESQVDSLLRRTPTTMDASKTCESDKNSSNEGHQSPAAATNANKNAFSIYDPNKIQGEPSEHHGTCQLSQERVAKAIQEKNQRDLQSQMEQLERHRASEMLDTRIKHWADGKQGNLRKLLSDLHSILWPECGWQPVSLMDLITVEAVKKAYRKATLCVHPDKLQQKGATIQQKYKAEKVFNLLKDAWNRFQYQEVSLQQIPI